MSELKTASHGEDKKLNNRTDASSDAMFFDKQEKKKVVGFIKQKTFITVAIDEGLLSSSQKKEAENQQDQKLSESNTKKQKTSLLHLVASKILKTIWKGGEIFKAGKTSKASKQIAKQFTTAKKRKSAAKKSNVQLTKQERHVLKSREIQYREQQRKANLTWKKRLVNFCVLLLCGVLTGVGLGTWYYKNVLSSNINWESAILERSVYEQSAIDTQNLALKKIQNGATSPNDLTLSENYQLALYNFAKATKYTLTATGKIATIATQTIFAEKKFDGKTYQSITISTGFMNVAERAQMAYNSNSVTIAKGTDITQNSATWNGQSNTYTTQQYKDLSGGLPSSCQNYIISNRTVLNDNDEVNIFETEDGQTLYSFTIELDPIYSALNYIEQIKYTSSLSSYPEFTSIQQTITIDSNWNFVSIEVLEKYSIVAYGMRNSCTGTLTSTFDFDSEVVIEI